MKTYFLLLLCIVPSLSGMEKASSKEETVKDIGKALYRLALHAARPTAEVTPYICTYVYHMHAPEDANEWYGTFIHTCLLGKVAVDAFRCLDIFSDYLERNRIY